MNDDYIEVRALDQSRIEGLKAWGWVSYLMPAMTERSPRILRNLLLGAV